MPVRRLYVFAYDIVDDRRRDRVASLLQSHGARVQDSVFEIRLTREGAELLAAEAKARMLPPDNLRAYPIPDLLLRHCIVHGGAPVSEAGEFYLF